MALSHLAYKLSNPIAGPVAADEVGAALEAVDALALAAQSAAARGEILAVLQAGAEALGPEGAVARRQVHILEAEVARLARTP